jgi:iron complex transport system substrate-binding protein
MPSDRTPLRIASLLPSATEIVYALGLGQELVAVTHECDYPPEATAAPAVTRSLLPAGLPSAEIDRVVRESARDAHTIYELDSERLAALAPDVVLTQSLCEVCAVPRSAVEAAVCSMPAAARVVSLDPHTMRGVLESIVAVGEALAVPDRARSLAGELRTRIAAVERAVAAAGRRPRVLCCEWLDPVYCGGHWVPEQVRLAGGHDGLGREGAPSVAITWDDVLDYAPEVLVLMPCGFDGDEAARRTGELSRRPGWADLPAVRTGRVFAVDGSAYFSRPGPRLVDGIELLAYILHSDRAPRPSSARGALRLASSGRRARFQPLS